MPEKPSTGLLGPLKSIVGAKAELIERAKARIARERAERGGVDLFPAGAVPPDHPLAKALGIDRAQALADAANGVLHGSAKLAADRRDLVARMSREGRLVRDIAQAAKCSYGRVVQIRSELRRRGRI